MRTTAITTITLAWAWAWALVLLLTVVGEVAVLQLSLSSHVAVTAFSANRHFARIRTTHIIAAKRFAYINDGTGPSASSPSSPSAQSSSTDNDDDCTVIVFTNDVNNNSNNNSNNGTLGDIMSDGGLVTNDAGGSLALRFGIVSNLDRMALTANGNLQRLVSSWYDAPVHVVVDRCHCLERGWDRLVHLTVHDVVFCRAQATIQVHDVQCQELVETGQVGLGQLFRYLDRLPTFVLLDAGYNADGGLWRRYELNCNELSCEIREDFVPNMWELQADDTNA